MSFTAKKTIQPAIIDSDDVETDYQPYTIVQTCSSSKDYLFLLPADSTYYTPPIVDDYMSGLEFISDQAVNLGIFTSTGGTRFLFNGCKNMIFNSTGIGNTTGANVWKLMQTTGLTAANVIWRTYSTT
jgi:hypothetical protein